MILLLRASLFNILFYGLTAVMCVLCLPGLFLPRRQALVIVRLFVRTVYLLEKIILGLDYEVRGRENIPSTGAFIVAAKHYAPYETFKLHLLFDDPAVVLKQELLRIPLWGRFLAKIDPIAIDRQNPKKAVGQIISGAQRVREQGRPLVIFPQGTRVRLEETPQDKPYRSGVARAQKAADLPIVPLALNTGAFWPRRGWIKKPGRVVFEFLPPIPPGNPPADVMKRLEECLEAESNRLLKNS
ncbi:MAG: 1-acyl-sn-glycerol-3-phosphate acyltransferase [Alphaproteobacteria bacterium]|nr:1-acyl-sn-glycerol-3-phosphate acyltransferase [Alphaproteobacteria bacterium]